MTGSFLRRLLGGRWVRSQRTVQEICGSPTANAVSCNCRHTMNCNRFHGLHLDITIQRLFWLPISCKAAYGLDFLRVVSSGFVTAMSAHPTLPRMGWAKAVSMTSGSTMEAPFGSPPRVV